MSCTNLAVRSELVFARDELVSQFVESRIGCQLGRPSTAIGLARGDLIGGVMYTHYTEGGSISAHIAGTGNWLTRPFLKAMFRYPFLQLKVRRITCYIAADNAQSIRLCEHMGFIRESVMQRATATGDVFIYRLFKEDCRYLR